ncbi:alginate lyase family protein [Stenotrophomonas sp. S39]|uniref:alginate lyase family protein n=1 Tax=Stenotrophomonas sp. S39 TaxID=2767451 RepID=UPI00190AC583|nr:alginate lyase family protein [Stenotrophomonas sp. S39]MBK0053469.1 alginate lyase family protein [Stenotrophomonas sp. S39]
MAKRIDPTSSTLDPDAVAAQSGVREEVSYPAKKIVNLSMLYRKGPSNEIANCLTTHLNALAESNYLEGSGEYNILYKSWMISAINFSLLGLEADSRSAPKLQDAKFRTWLGTRTHEITAFFRESGCHNNHCYWAGVAAASSARYLKSDDPLQFSKWVLLQSEKNVNDSGQLSAEVSRGTMAFHYSAFSIAALLVQTRLWNQNDASVEAFVSKLSGRFCSDALTGSSGTTFAGIPAQNVKGASPYVSLITAAEPEKCGALASSSSADAKSFFFGWNMDYVRGLVTGKNAP